MTFFSQLVLAGLMSGAVYALLAMGLVLTFRTAGIPNLAHGEAYAAAGLVAASLVHAGFGLVVALVLGIFAAVAVSSIVEYVVLRPRRHWSMAGLMLASLGFAFFSRGILLLCFGSDPMSFPNFIQAPPVRIAGGAIQIQGIILIVCSLVSCAAVYLILTRTDLGLRLRASSINANCAQLMGINVEMARLSAFAIAGLLAGLAAVCLVPLTSVDFQTGLAMTVRGFIAAALAGMSESRAIVCGLILGLFEAVVSGYIGALFQDPLVFAGLIALAVYQSRQLRYGGAARA